MVEGEGFLEYTRELEPRFRVPARTGTTKITVSKKTQDNCRRDKSIVEGQRRSNNDGRMDLHSNKILSQ